MKWGALVAAILLLTRVAAVADEKPKEGPKTPDNAVNVRCVGILHAPQAAASEGESTLANLWTLDLNRREEGFLASRVWVLDVSQLDPSKRYRLNQYAGKFVSVVGFLRSQEEKYLVNGKARWRDRWVVLVEDSNPVHDQHVAPSVQIDVRGTLKSPTYAIGGETTGTVVKSQEGSWELDLGQNNELKDFVTLHKNKPVAVSGVLTTQPLVSARKGDDAVRHIVHVEKLMLKPVD